ncbi:hypothetical protein N7451_012854 [Penicillium sp. IBT 35674x]|nr:hypothetical protein N7451_012854 [Penicillium sp. IBT 35674x]
MTLTDGQSLQTIAPLRTDEPSKATHTLPRRTKRSTACSACKGRKSRCTGTQPCGKCIETGSNCLFAEALDRRRKYAQKRAEQNLDATQPLLDRIVEAFSEGDIAQLSWLLSIVKKRGIDEQLKDGITGVVRGQAQQSLEIILQDPEQEDLSEALAGRETEYILCRVKSNVQTESFPRYRSRLAHSVDSSSSSVSVGSLNEVDTLTEDPNRNEETRETGYIGKNLRLHGCKNWTPEPEI